MRQIIQHFRTGITEIVDLPAPASKPGHLLVRTSRSLVSAGTERMLVEFGRANLLQKARQQPDKVRMVLEKVRTDGLATTLEAVTAKLDQPIPLGYCNVGTVIEVGAGVTGFSAGDRVVSNGPHAEIVRVPMNLCARVPRAVPDEQAVFTVAAAIGLQGVRLLAPTLGETVVVTGLGLIGLLAVQLLRANGCRVIGIDFDAARLDLAQRLGVETLNAASNPVEAALALSGGRGVDAVLITASTDSNGPVTDAAKMCRQRGRIVLVGVAGLELSRADFYAKELTFQVSCSYGPGRYDPAYEERGADYPFGFVRWTEQRNFEAVLDQMAAGRIDVAPLVSHRFRLEQAQDAYALLASGQPSLGILLEYPQAGVPVVPAPAEYRLRLAAAAPAAGEPRIGFLGAGNYAGRVLIPAFKSSGARLHSVVSSGGLSALHFGRKHGFEVVASDESALLDDPEVDAVVVATRHDAHARQVTAALRAGKHVFCEKPLCLRPEQLTSIEAELTSRPDRILAVGFNRRFAPQIAKMKRLLDQAAGPKAIVMTVNAGSIPASHWTQDPDIGGGRIVGEACHFVDLIRYLAGAPIVRSRAAALGALAGKVGPLDSVALTLEMADGSVGTIHYLANGDKRFPKERIEVFCGGKVLQLDNFRRLRGWGWPGFTRMNLWRQDKGQRQCAAAFLAAIRSGGAAPVPLDEVIEVSRVSIELQQMLAG